MTKNPLATKTKVLDAAVKVIRTKGYSATTVDDLCLAAGVKKGAFFHHFPTKEQLAIEATDHFASLAAGLFAQAPYHELSDPVDRLLGYVDFRIQILKGAIPEYTCLLGTLVQEVYSSHPNIRAMCEQHLGEHIDVLIEDIELAIKDRGIIPTWTASSLGFYMQSVIQGAFVFAKAKGGSDIAADCLRHLRSYLECLFK